MKKLFFIFCSLLFVSCTELRPTTPISSTGRFIVTYEQSSFNCGALILQDTITGEKYLFFKCGYAGGLTHL